MITRTQQNVLYGPSIFSPCNHESVHRTKAILQPRSRSLTWSLSLLCRSYSLQISQTPSRPLIQVNLLGVSRVTLLQLNFIRRRDPSVKSLRDVSVPKFIYDRIMSPSRGCMKTSQGMGDRMGGPIRMGVPLLQIQMKATYDDDGEAMYITSQVM